MRRWAAILLAVIAVSCGDRTLDIETSAKKKIQPLAVTLPAAIIGLEVRGEDVSTGLAAARPSYVEALGMFSLRSEDVLQATLQIGRFREQASYRLDSFRQSIVSRIGGSAPRSFRLGDDTVYLSTGTRQRIATWFRGRHLFVLAIREDFKEWRTLLRSALEVRP